MNREERRKCIEWMLNQIDAIDIASQDVKLDDGNVLSQCGVSNRVHVYGNGFRNLVKATGSRVKREELDEKTWRDSLMFCGVEFMTLTDKTYGGGDEEQAE